MMAEHDRSSAPNPLAMAREDFIVAIVVAAFPADRIAYSSAVGGTGRRYRERTDIEPWLDRVAQVRRRAGRAWDTAHRRRRRVATPPARVARDSPRPDPAASYATTVADAPRAYADEPDLAGWLAQEEADLARIEARLARDPENGGLREWVETTRWYLRYLRADVHRRG